MSEWTLLPLEAIATSVRAFAMGPFGSNIKTENFVSRGVPVIQGRNLGGTRLDEQGFVFLTDEKADELASSGAVSGDIVFTHRGTLGQVAMIPRKSQYDRYIISQSQMKVTVDESKALPEFVTYWFQSRLGQAELFAYSSQTGVPAIAQPLSSLRKMKVICPPLAEQRAIAGVLGALDDKIESNRRLASLAQDLGDAIFLGEAGAERSLGDIAELIMGSSPPGSTYNEAGRGLPFYQGVADFDFRFPRLRIYCDGPVRIAEAGDALVSVRAPVGRLNRAQAQCCIGRGLAAARSKSPRTLFYALRAAGDVWAPYNSEGTVFGAINAADLQAVRIPWPSDENLSRCERDLEEIDDRLTVALRENIALIEFRDALLPELLSGRLRVRDAEKVVEEVV